MSRAYLLGAMHDGTVRRRTLRICQREEAYVLFLKELIERLGRKAWTYKEGRNRDVFIVEFSRTLLESFAPRTRAERLDYVRGYFDAEGGIPARSGAEPYVYFAQKNHEDLDEVRRILTESGIDCGRIHNPSAAVDPRYWRFYVRRASIARFCSVGGSWHPRKGPRLLELAVTRPTPTAAASCTRPSPSSRRSSSRGP
jgi:hypothetical protein